MENRIKQLYDQEPVPPELETAVEMALSRGRRERRKRRLAALWRGGLATAACGLIVLMLNISPAFASTMGDIPMLGQVFRVLTFRDYSFSDQVKIVDVKLPRIEGDAGWTREVNETIAAVMDQVVAQAESQAEQYYDAYLQTGGLPESFTPVEIVVDYEVKFIDEQYLSFIVEKYDSITASSYERFFYNFDASDGRALSLADFYGEDWREAIAEKVREGLEKLGDDQKALLFEGTDILSLLTEERGFYLDQAGKPVVVFNKYELGAGALGPLEFALTEEGAEPLPPQEPLPARQP